MMCPCDHGLGGLTRTLLTALSQANGMRKPACLPLLLLKLSVKGGPWEMPLLDTHTSISETSINE